MGAILTRIEDPRDNLEKATRDEVWQFAEDNGVHFDHRTTPKPLMEKILREKGFVNIKPAVRVLGRPIDVDEHRASDNGMPEAPKVVTVDADEDLARQFREANAIQNRRREVLRQLPDIDPMELPMGKLRAELKRRGIKFDRRDKMDVLRGKLSGSHAS